MALSDGKTNAFQAFAWSKRETEHRAEMDRAAAEQAARESSMRTYADKQGTQWSYVVVDGKEVRIQRVATDQKLLEVVSEIEGMPVTAVAHEAMAKMESVEEVIFPDSITAIGGNVMHDCTNLRRVTFPRYLDDFNSNWLRSCPEVTELTLPGKWQRILASIFDSPKLEKLHIGAGTSQIEPGAFQKSRLTEITVDPANESFFTDGAAIYSQDGATMWVLAVPKPRYTVRPGCTFLARKAFSSFPDFLEVSLPDTLEDIGEFAFTRTALTSFTAPSSLRVIREKAFYRIKTLKDVTLNDGLVEIGEEAFAGTAIMRLELPRTLERLGRRIGLDTKLTYAGDDATLTLAPDALYLDLDKDGVLYSNQSGEKVLVQVVNPALVKLTVQDGTKRIAENAARMHKSLEALRAPDGLEVIESEAFKGCRPLYWVELPDTVHRIENQAFLDTSIQHIHLPKSLSHLGPQALVTYGSHHIGTQLPSLDEVEIPEGIAGRFFTVPGLLCQRRENGSVRVMVCLGGESIIIPDEATSIDEYCFSNRRGIRELVISDRIRDIGMCGLALDCYVEHIRVNLKEPKEGHTYFDFNFPFNDRSVQQIKLAFGMMRSVDVGRIFNAYDQCITNGAGLQGGRGDSGMTLYDQAQRILARLADPVYMSKVHRSTCLSFLKHSIEDICVEIARKDDRRSLDVLLDFEFLNEENLLRVIDRVNSIQDAAMTGYLLEVRRRLFGADSMVDYEL